MTEHRPQNPVRDVVIQRWQNDNWNRHDDLVAVEEPLEVQVVTGDAEVAMHHPIAVTMRTPGHDDELALGFLYTEGVLAQPDWVQAVQYRRAEDGAEDCNVIQVYLHDRAQFDPKRLSRHVFTSSSCGICGKITIEQVRAQGLQSVTPMALDPAMVLKLPQQLRDAQAVFDATGGLHAAALFDRDGNLTILREDVGRHNALDKLIGHLLHNRLLPATDHLLMLSGRASFELIQKAVFAGIPAVAAVGAPSSLAVDMAREFGISLVGFLRDGRFNRYNAP